MDAYCNNQNNVGLDQQPFGYVNGVVYKQITSTIMRVKQPSVETMVFHGTTGLIIQTQKWNHNIQYITNITNSGNDNYYYNG